MKTRFLIGLTLAVGLSLTLAGLLPTFSTALQLLGLVGGAVGAMLFSRLLNHLRQEGTLGL